MTAEGIWVLIGSSLLLYSSIYQEPAGVSQDEKKKNNFHIIHLPFQSNPDTFSADLRIQ